MKKAFIKTKNVKNFVALMENLKKCPANIPKMALVYPITETDNIETTLITILYIAFLHPAPVIPQIQSIES